MRKNYRILLILCSFSLIVSSCGKKSLPEKEKGIAKEFTKEIIEEIPTPLIPLAPGELPFKKGETVTYRIKSLGINGGEATLSFEGSKNYKGKEAYAIIFRARAMNFFDEERIYADPKTFYPMAVVRDLNIWGKKENITEEYDEGKGVITITKLAGGITTTDTISKKGPIDNIYCFIYRYRNSGTFKVGDSFLIHLPTKDIEMKSVKVMPLKVGGRTFEAFFLQSDPAKYKVWLDTSLKKIPLRINDAMGLSDTAMTMTQYKETE